MHVCDEIIEARDAGLVRCGLSAVRAGSVPELARELRLLDEADGYTEIDAAAARRVVVGLLHRDLAYDSEVMPADRAADLADRFLALFGPDARYFTNVDLPSGSGRWHSWNAMTAATFDAGVLALGADRSGCLWVEDED